MRVEAVLCGMVLSLGIGCGPVSGQAPPETTADAGVSPGPVGQQAIEAWLATGAYKSWHCEPAPHAGRSPSPHGQNRICSNELLSAAGPGLYPVGVESVKEIWNSGATEISGYALTRKVAEGDSGDNWYWYERIGTRINADGLGDTPAATFGCVACHSAAGADSAHSGRDFVYTQVP